MDLLSVYFEVVKNTTYMDRQGKAAVIYNCNLYLMVSILHIMKLYNLGLLTSTASP